MYKKYVRLQLKRNLFVPVSYTHLDVYKRQGVLYFVSTVPYDDQLDRRNDTNFYTNWKAKIKI